MGELGADHLSSLLARSDARFGPFGEVRRTRLGGTEPPWWYCSVPLARSPIGSRFSPDPVASAGTSIDPNEAMQRAIGEAVERYSALNAEIDGRLMPLHPEIAHRLPICAPDEPCPPSLRNRRLDVPVTHVAVRDLAADRELPFPAGFVHLNFWPQPAEPLIALPISTGLAFSRDLPRAIWTGLCEVIERDALMQLWWSRSGSREIVCEVADLPGDLADRLERFACAGLYPRFFDMTTEVRVPSVFCVVSSDSYPHLVVSASCRGDPAAACAKALDEIVAMRLALSRPHTQLEPDRVPAEVHRLEDHARLYAGGAGAEAFNFLLENPALPPISFQTFVDGDWWDSCSDMSELAYFARRLRDLGLTVLWTEVTAPEMADAGWVVKVVVPEMVPLSPDDRVRWLGTRRLLSRMGATEASISLVNPYPHPFA